MSAAPQPPGRRPRSKVALTPAERRAGGAATPRQAPRQSMDLRSDSAGRLLRWLDRFPDLSVVVWGDFVADEFVAGEIARVSREAPVLILKRRSRRVLAGGGANAAVNLAALGVRVRLIGAVGDDEPGRRLREIFTVHGIDLGGLITLPGWTTPTKTRILAHHAHTTPQQVIRVDQEPLPLAPAAQAHLRARLRRAAERAARGARALLVSDYGYGMVEPADLAPVRARLAPPAVVSVDARFRIGAYTGIGAATPNENELEAALGVEVNGSLAVLDRAGMRLRRQLDCEHLLVTRGRDGMALYEPGRPVLHLPVFGSQQAIDVTGAGDTVIAVFTAALAAGADGPEAAELANCAGGVVVMKPQTATCTRRELAAACTARAHP